MQEFNKYKLSVNLNERLQESVLYKESSPKESIDSVKYNMVSPKAQILSEMRPRKNKLTTMMANIHNKSNLGSLPTISNEVLSTRKNITSYSMMSERKSSFRRNTFVKLPTVKQTKSQEKLKFYENLVGRVDGIALNSTLLASANNSKS